MKIFTLLKQMTLKYFLVSFLLFISGYSLKAQTGTTPSGTGTSGDPYLIASLLDLKWIADQVNAGTITFSGEYFKQTANIDASATSEASWNSGAGWIAIGAEANGIFSGSYDGQGFVISNLYINNPSGTFYGLFGYCMNNATIKNLGVTNVSITAGDEVGGLAGYMDVGGIVSDCYVTGVVSSSSTGIVGALLGEAFDATITNCYAECTISEGAKAGGLIGMLSGGSLSNSYASGSITASQASYIGGLIGGIQNSEGNINSCYSSSAITINGEYAGGKSFTGGFIGYIYQNALSAVTISDCYATGSISGTNFSAGSRIGGFIGENTSTVSNCYTTVSIPSTVATTLKGAFVGENHKEGPTDASHYGVVNNNCYWNSNIYTNGYGDNTGATFSATGKTTAEMQTTSTFTGWNFPNPWKRIDTRNNKYPYLEWQVLPFTATVSTTAISTYDATSATMGGNITADGGATVTERGVVYSSTDATPTIGETGVTKDANGTGIGTFSKSITGLSGNITYYVCAYTTNAAGTNYGTVVSFTTNVLTVTWDGTAWSPSAPTSLDNVIIDGTYNDSGFACHDLTINAGKQVTISSGTLAVGGNLILKSDASGTASLIGTTTVGGTTMAERYMTGNAWHLVSPIASGQNVADFLTANTAVATNGTNRGLMDYKTSTNTWNTYYQTTGASGTMDAGKGYSARITANGTVTFTGTLASGNTTVSLSNVGEGWNCVGNPYPSAINMNTTASAVNNFLKTNALDAANIDPSYCVYVWDDGSKTYQVLNNVPDNPRDPGINVFSPGQGFFVKANGAGTIQFRTAMQVHNTSAVLKSTDIQWTSVALKATSTSTSSTAQVYFHKGMTKGLDPTYDAGLLRGSNGLSLYTKLIDDNGVDFAIQCLPEKGMDSFVIPVGLDAKAGGEVKFSATATSLPDGCSIILEDRLNKTLTLLESGKELAVAVAANTSGTGRFYIHTSNLTTGTSGLLPEEGFSLKAYPANGVIQIEGQVSRLAKAYLFNTSGSNLGVFNLQEGTRNNIPASGLATGVYLLKVTDGSKQFNTKVVLY